MSDIRDFFIKTLDEAESGINGMMIRFMNKIKSVDSKIHSRLVEQDIKPQYFSFRYLPITLLDMLHFYLNEIIVQKERVSVLNFFQGVEFHMLTAL